MLNAILETAKKAGINIISRHKAAKLLALCFCYGDEPFVFNKKLHGDTVTAANLFDFKGGEVPDAEVSRQFKIRCSEIMNNKAHWQKEIEEEYGVEFPEYKDVSICIPEGFNGKTRRGQSACRRGGIS